MYQYVLILKVLSLSTGGAYPYLLGRALSLSTSGQPTINNICVTFVCVCACVCVYVRACVRARTCMCACDGCVCVHA